MVNGLVTGVVVGELPTMLVLVVGLVLAVTRLSAGAWARLAVAGFATLLANDVVWIAVSASYAFRDGPYGGLPLMQLWGVVGTFLVVVGTALLVAAVFVGRGSRNEPPRAAEATVSASPYGPPGPRPQG